MHPQFGADHHQGITHIVAGVSHVGQLYAFNPAQLFSDCEHVRQHLGGMKLISQPVPYRNAGILCQFLHNTLLKAPVLDSLVNAPQHPGRIRNAFFFANLGARRV